MSFNFDTKKSDMEMLRDTIQFYKDYSENCARVVSINGEYRMFDYAQSMNARKLSSWLEELLKYREGKIK